MTGNTKIWRAPLAGLASVAMIATMGMAAATANAATAGVKITFDGNGLTTADGKKSVEESVTAGDTLANAMNAAENALVNGNSNVQFTGWYTTADYGVADSAALTTDKAEGAVTLYAHWVEKDQTNSYYDVAFTTGGIVTGGVNSFTIAANDVIDPDQIPSVDNAGDGKLLSGWKAGNTTYAADLSDLDFSAAATEGSNDITLAAQSEAAWKVTFKNNSNANAQADAKYNFVLKNADDTSVSGDIKYDVAKDTVFSAAYELPVAKTADNKLATIWTTRQTKSGEKVEDLPRFDADAAVTSDLTLYPGAGEQYYTVTLDYNDSRANKTVTVDVVENGTVSEPQNVAYDYGKESDGTAKTYGMNQYDQKVHYEFAGWYNGNDKYDFSTPVTANGITLTAKWTVTEVGIDFDPNYGVAKAETVWFKDGDTFAAPTFEREGFDLTGWKSAAKNSATVTYDKWEGTVFTLVDGELTGFSGAGQSNAMKAYKFTAQWDFKEGAKPSDLLAKLESKVAVTKDGKYIKGEDQDEFTADSFDQYVKDYQAYLKSKGTPKTNDDYAKLIDKLEAMQAKLVQVGDLTLYRLYNLTNGDHYYTADETQAKFLAAIGWTQEKAEYKVVAGDATFGTDVYSLWNPNTGEHLLTADKGEAAALEKVGWQWDNDKQAVFKAPQGATKAVYRVYNPNTNGPAHHYAGLSEASTLVGLGWLWDNDGDVMFYFG